VRRQPKIELTTADAQDCALRRQVAVDRVQHAQLLAQRAARIRGLYDLQSEFAAMQQNALVKAQRFRVQQRNAVAGQHVRNQARLHAAARGQLVAVR